ncbi:MAG: membrane protein [Gammaproteobacteria bacterium BRH_c0]|nr:MAG: membrane protein [Gammaproteobacteria bacterium BRH_c0]
MASRRELLGLLLVLLAVAAWSCIDPHERLIWWMESLPVWIGLAILLITRRSFPLTRLCYYLIFVHALILLVGAHYTYARVPLGDWFAAALDLDRNHYDRFAHLAQGFVPAIIAREILIRLQVIRTVSWLFFLVCCFCLAFSALYEIIEWQSAVWGGDSSQEFLGTQGDIWDAQWDMTLALIGAMVAQLLLAKCHNRQIRAIFSGHSANH